MARAVEQAVVVGDAFDEQQFYLDEFRGRTLLLSLGAHDLRRDADYETLGRLLRSLLLNDTRVILLVAAGDRARGDTLLRRVQRRLGPLVFRDETLSLFPQRRHRAAAFMHLSADALVHAASTSGLLGAVWAVLRRGPLFVGVVAGLDHDAAPRYAGRIAARLRVHKWVLIDTHGGVRGADGKALSFMNEGMLATLLRAGEAEWAGLANRREIFETVRSALRGGVSSVNLCTLAGTARELFTYDGSGTLFTLADYCTVERLGIDDFEEVERLIARGQREGLLKPRTADEVAALLVNGYGATIGAHHLAGMCALITAPYVHDRGGELAGLYTITRFKGEGVGARLVSRVFDDARDANLAFVFACTTEARAGMFFERQGFRPVGRDDIPATKWHGYDPARLAEVAVYRVDIAPAAVRSSPA
jgi:amino-acid N-acetyltransferase